MDDYTEIDTEENEMLAEQDRLAKLKAFAATIVDKRREAIDGRKNSGIEYIWQEDDDNYDGVDEANRHETMLKPSTIEGRVLMRGRNEVSRRSNAFLNITQPYVDMGSARVADMMLPTEDIPFKYDPTPIPEVADVLNDTGMMPGGQHTVGDAAKAFIAYMRKKADNAETQVWDWLVESRWHGEMRKVIEQAARIGAGCLKGPYPVKRKKRSVQKLEDGTIELAIEEVLKPASKMIDVWNLYPDPSCGDDIHNGSYILERDFITARQLKDMKGTGYIDSEIKEALKEGPNKKNIDSKGKTIETDNFEIWYYYGFADSEDMQAAGCECEEGETIPVCVTLVNDRVIKASLSVLDSGEFPYDIMVWQKRIGHWAGTGIARQVRTAQRMVNAAARNLMDNAGVSAGPQIIMRDGIVYPADGVWELSPLKIWRVDEDADIQQVQHAITSIVIPTMQAELENIIKLALEFAERATSMPLLLQGQQGASTETVGGMQILQANASTVLRRIAKICDDDIIEPHVTRYYEWLMTYSDNNDAKGDYVIVPQGSSSFYERDAQNQMIMQLVPMAANPAFGLNPDLLMVEILKMNKITPDRVRFTDEEIKQMKEAAAKNPPQDPNIAGQIEIAKIRAANDMEIEKLKQASDMQEIERKNSVAESELAAKLQMMEQEHQFDLQLKEIDREIEIMRLSSAQNISLESIKAQLAQNVQRLNTQKELSAMNHIAKQVATPAVEPAGKAPTGEAFQK